MGFNNKKRIAHNVAWAVAGKVIRLLTEFIVGIFVARYLGADQYGLMNYVISIVAIFNIIAEFGLSNIEIRELSKSNNKVDIILGTSFMTRLVLSVIAYSVILIFVFASKLDKETQTLILIYGCSVFFTPFEIIRNYFTSIVKNRDVVITGIIRNIIGALIKFVLLLLKAPLIAFIIALLFDFIIIAGGYITSYRRSVNKSRWSFDISLSKNLLRDAFPLLLSGAAILIYQRIDQVIIKNLLNNESVAYFSIAGRFTEFQMFIPMIMSQTITPLLVRCRENDVREYIYKSQQYIDVIVWIAIILSCITSVFSFYLVKFTFGQQYLASVPILRILAFKAIFSALSNASGQLIIIEGKHKWVFIRNIMGCAACIVMNLTLIPRYSTIGSAYATIITLFISGFLANFFIAPYRQIFKKQIIAILFGWRSIFKLLKR